VPGDIIYLRVGDKVPADGRIISLKTTSFNTDEGSLTGESSTVSKSVDALAAGPGHTPVQSKYNMVFSGTVVTNGGAFTVVTATGMKSEIGRIEQGV
jgi:Ca2+-transporting ATPase